MRLILDLPRSATRNMAIDEFLLEQQAAENAPPVLRIYSWDNPSCTLGYFQNVGETVRSLGLEKKGISAARRITGGGLVMHGADLAFSLCLRQANPFFSADAKTSYLKINEVLLDGLKKIHPALDYADCKTVPSGRPAGRRVCFDSPACYDLMLKGKKVVGASQRRRGGAFLHQSAIFLKDPPQKLAALLKAAFEKKWGVVFREEPLNGRELEESEKKERARYSSEEWALPAIKASADL